MSEKVTQVAEAFSGLNLRGTDGKLLIEEVFNDPHIPKELERILLSFEDIETIANRIRQLQEIALQNTLIRE